ncbi:unnamed protein product [Owenia fusiformis]|uniref:Uncharacterized protein n=1 Tax=Owenia fusiformis TaxID=6347 RepID=A0A8J1TCX4_OWEFU|nr:unnamed protein product [Owenia fusiformis]
MEKSWEESLGFNAIAAFLFFLEVYHIVGHALILFRIRLLPRKDLVRVRYYFLIDALTVFVTSFVYTGRLRWLALLQNAQHIYFFITWNSPNEKHFTNRVISWSSLDWLKDEKTQSRQEWFIFLGTLFDVIVHCVNAYILSQYMHAVEMVVGLSLVSVLSYLILYNTRYAWSNPDEVPKWVEKRVKPVPPQNVGNATAYF